MVLAPSSVLSPRPGALPATSHAGHGCCQDEYRSRFGQALVPHGSSVRSLVGVASDGSGRAMALSLRCRSWRCVCCSKALRQRNRARALRGAHGRVAMITLTVDPSEPHYAAALAAYRAAGGVGTAAPSVKHVRESWNRLGVALRRDFGRLSYFRGLELTKAGTAHLHVVVRVGSLSDFWRLRTLVGPLAVRAQFGRVSQVDLARRSKDVARYVTKADALHVAGYVTKGLDGRFPRWTRRASWSGDWAEWSPATRIAGYTWRVAPASVDVVKAGLIASDFIIADPARLRVSARPPGAGWEVMA